MQWAHVAAMLTSYLGILRAVYSCNTTSAFFPSAFLYLLPAASPEQRDSVSVRNIIYRKEAVATATPVNG